MHIRANNDQHNGTIEYDHDLSVKLVWVVVVVVGNLNTRGVTRFVGGWLLQKLWQPDGFIKF